MDFVWYIKNIKELWADNTLLYTGYYKFHVALALIVILRNAPLIALKTNAIQSNRLDRLYSISLLIDRKRASLNQ